PQALVQPMEGSTECLRDNVRRTAVCRTKVVRNQSITPFSGQTHPLHRFRQGVRQITKDIETAPEDPQFAHEIDEAWTTTVAPALAEIEAMIEQNSSLREKVRRVAADPAALSGLVGAIGLGIAAGPASALPSAVALMLSSTAAVVGGGLAAIRTDLTQHAAREAITKAQFYFLYGANAALA
ncbi:hypothetical protein, partial [Rhodococcus sp. 27YEA6]|uniref:hypothetical protein n=1 Tax=Rhodococcus sp. 27YEA6 TaxID=3156273 RepID=UPI00383953C9